MPTTQELTTTVEKELKDGAVSVIAKAHGILVRDQQSYELACAVLTQEIKPLTQRWLTYWTPLKESAYKTYKGIMGKLQEGTDPLEKAERHLKSEIAKYEQEQQRLKEAAQRKAQAEAEAAAKLEAEKEAEFAAMSGASEEQIAAIVPAPVVAAPVETDFQRASGVSTRQIWKCKVIDVRKLALAVAKGQAPINYLIPNEKALNARAAADKSLMSVAGCQAYTETVVAGRVK